MSHCLMIANQLLLMDHVGIMSPTLSPLSLILFLSRVSIKVFSRFGFMTYMFFLVFWFDICKRYSEQKRVIHFLTVAAIVEYVVTLLQQVTWTFLNFADSKLILKLFFFFQMEQYSKALKILVYKLEDYAEAERFCELHSKVIINARLSTNI